jgi:hypothetical protein
MKKISLLVCGGILLAMIFLIAPVAADKYLVTSNSYAPVAGASVTISAQLSTDADVPITTAGNVVTWSNTGTGGSFSALTSTTNASGIATVTFTTNTVAGTVSITGTDAGSLTGTSATITTVAGAATQIAKTAGDGQSATVGTAVPNSLNVSVRDVYDNPVSGVIVNFAVSPGVGSVSVLSVTTDSNGIATEGSWILGSTAGTNTLTATSGTLTVTFTATATAVTTTTTTTPAINSTTNGSINVKSSPSISKIFLNNVFKDYTPKTLYNITPGTYTVMIRSAGYNDYSESITVTAGNTSYVTGSLVLAPEETTATTTVPHTTVTTARTTVMSTIKVPTPWPTDTPAPASPVSIIAVLGAVGIGLIVLRKR